MAAIRAYRRSDAGAVGRLIARTYGEFNLGFAGPDQRAALLGPFQFAGSADPTHRADIAAVIAAPVVLVAEEDGTVVGVLRGGRVDGQGRVVLQSLFVDGGHQRRGIGRGLVDRFERTCRARGHRRVKVAATEYAVPFYEALGYRRSTGLRVSGSFQGRGLPYQPMKKALG